MKRTILVHVGTSVLAEEGGWRGRLKAADVTNMVHRNTAPTEATVLDWQRQLVMAVEAEWKRPKAARDRVPAEIASLDLLEAGPNDRLVLLRSDTLAGAFCAEVLLGALKHRPQGAYARITGAEHVSVERIAGLKVDDALASEAATRADTFVREGLTSYVVAVCHHYRERRSGERLIFNITGGYKGLIPMARDLALLLQNHSAGDRDIVAEMCYLYEGSSQLISYGALPIGASVFESTRDITDQLREANEVNGAEWRFFTTNELRSPYFEQRGDRVHLSPLGAVVWALRQHLDQD